MRSLKSFSVRSSGRIPGKFYLDCAGSFKISDISELTGLEKAFLDEVYLSEEAVLDENIGVYYFPSRDHAIRALKRIESFLESKGAGKVVYLTFEEMEYIRQALINEGSNIVNVRNDLKKGIFDKFNS